MAYSSVRVQFEIGHEASVRTKKTPEGFTHDWEVFVRGADNTDIQCFVDKVVFHLHETFPKPRRVIKEPPYVVKESGYAGFVLPIDVYLKNKEEPKKISFLYDLNLQPSGPPISRVLREPRLFQNPSEDFRRKLIRGGGVGVDTPTSDSHADDPKSSSSVSMSQTKSKITESPVKKHKTDISSNHSFADLFGPPIRRSEPKKLPEQPKKPLEPDPSKDKKKLSKHGSYKDEKETLKDKEKYSDKERSKEKDKSKEKPNKRLPSPPLAVSQIKPKEDHKKHDDKEKKKDEHEEKKKRKEEKEKKEKTKEPDKQEHKKEKKEMKDMDYLKKLNSNKPHDIKPNGEKQNENPEKERTLEKEKHKHRHKKKEKEKYRDKEKHRKEKDKEKNPKEKNKEKENSTKKRHDEGREKEEKIRRKSKSPSPVQERMKKGPLNALLDELGSSDSASPLSEEESIPSFKSFSKPPAKIVPEPKPQPQPVNITPKLKSTNLNAATDPKLDEVPLQKLKKDKSSGKKSKKFEDVEKKKAKEERRTRSPSTEKEEVDQDKERGPTKDDKEKERLDDEKPKPKDKENKKRKREKSEEKHLKKKSGSEGGPDAADPPEEIRRTDRFTKEYIAQLKDLQHRIMTLEDNAELQKVVNIIAETGQYEITKKTFDFDLCALDFETVKRLLEFFALT